MWQIRTSDGELFLSSNMKTAIEYIKVCIDQGVGFSVRKVKGK